MPLKTLVKVSSLTNLSDARYCAGMDVQMLGFQAVSDLPRHISAVKFQEIRGWVTGPKIVAEIHGIQGHEQLVSIIEAYRPDYLELGLTELRFLENIELPLILRLQTNDSISESESSRAQYVLLDVNDGREIEVPRIFQVSSLNEAQSVMDRGGSGGIALMGSDEFSPGLKSYDTLAPILEMLEEEN